MAVDKCFLLDYGIPGSISFYGIQDLLIVYNLLISFSLKDILIIIPHFLTYAAFRLKCLKMCINENLSRYLCHKYIWRCLIKFLAIK